MLLLLEALAAATVDRDPRQIARLLALPFARRLPRRVREEALAIARRGPAGWIAPVHTLRCLQQERQLDGDEGRWAGLPPQLELPLRAAG